MKAIDDSQLLLQDMLDDVAHGDVVGHADVVTNDLKASFTRDRRHFGRQRARDAETGAARGEPEGSPIGVVIDVVVIVVVHLFGGREVVHVVAVDDFDGMSE